MLPDGESYKNFTTLTHVFDALFDNHHRRGTTLIALGGDDGMADDECVLELYAVYDTGDYDGFTGSAICNGESLGVDKDGAATVTYSFQGAAQLGWFSGAARP